MITEIKIKLDEGAYEPIRAIETDGGLDLRTPHDVTVPKRGSAKIDTGTHIEIPPDTVGIIEPKSGLNFNHDLISFGTIDHGYMGSIRVKLYNLGDEDYTFKAGDKITQLVIKKIVIPKIRIVNTVEELYDGYTERGNGGFGSTGR